ncbi:carbohydrate deacetylase [Sporomusa aerivorans]|uniref:carbohydrate deacetylase n=1 Tax=Sporomusa aerivorans TaxID=204936 RepID=UPI00352AB11A
MLQLIINADDLGLTPGCNDGIITALNQGIVTDATLLVNAGYTEDALAKLKEKGISRVGLHLNLTLGKPVLPAREVPSLVGDGGRFHRRIAPVAAAMLPEEIERELYAQVEKFQATGLGLTHLDSHHHAHGYPEILYIVIKLAKKLAVPLRQTSEAVRQQIREAGVPTTDYFSLDFYSQGVSLAGLETVIAGHRQGTLEIMSHPAVVDNTLMQLSTYNTVRGNELTILTSPAMRNFIREQGVSLIGFDALRD